jgi:hypothetical protein
MCLAIILPSANIMALGEHQVEPEIRPEERHQAGVVLGEGEGIPSPCADVPARESGREAFNA